MSKSSTSSPENKSKQKCLSVKALLPKGEETFEQGGLPSSSKEMISNSVSFCLKLSAEPVDKYSSDQRNILPKSSFE